LLTWIVPGLFVFLAFHIGQPGYVLLIAPPMFLGIAATWPTRGLSLRGPGLAAVGALLIGNVLLTVWLPPRLYETIVPAGQPSVYARQYLPRENDAHWRRLTAFVEIHDPATTVVLTSPGGPRAGGSFRHLSYLLPAFRVYGLGHGFDHAPNFGHLYTALDGRDDYAIHYGYAAKPLLWLPPGVERLLIPDLPVASLFARTIPMERYPLPGGEIVWSATLEPGTVLIFHTDDSGKPWVESRRSPIERTPGPEPLSRHPD
jgi:hypothetical protein